MQVSVKLAPVFEYGVLEEFWRSADELGFHTIWNYDHFYGLGLGLGLGLSEHEQPTLEAWTTLSAMAALTSRARIGCLVSGVTYRHPAVVANMAATIDHISGGRLTFGLGAAWHEAEHRGYGIDFPPAGTRIAMLDEALEIITQLWTRERTTFRGRFWSLDEALCNPKPVQQPRPPIVVGGSGERKTLRVVAKHADEWNTPGSDPTEFARLSKILDEHCDAVGRAPSEVRRSVQLFILPHVEGQADMQFAQFGAYEDAGCDHVVLSFYSPPSRVMLEELAARS